jgi:hypothetical protein
MVFIFRSNHRLCGINYQLIQTEDLMSMKIWLLSIVFTFPLTSLATNFFKVEKLKACEEAKGIELSCYRKAYDKLVCPRPSGQYANSFEDYYKTQNSNFVTKIKFKISEKCYNNADYWANKSAAWSL